MGLTQLPRMFLRSRTSFLIRSKYSPASNQLRCITKDSKGRPVKGIGTGILKDCSSKESMPLKETVRAMASTAGSKTTQCPPPLSGDPNPGHKADSFPPATPPPSQDSNNKLWIIIAVAVGSSVGLGYYMDWFNFPSGKKSLKKSSVSPQITKIPATSAEISKQVPYLLIGGGTASFAAFRAIKSHNPKAKVLVIANEIEMPYMRPPLSKELWLNADKNATNLNNNNGINRGEKLMFKQWNGVERSLYYEPSDFYISPTKLMDEPNGGVAVVRGYTVRKVDVANRKAILTDGTEIQYEECLLATGSTPKNLDIFESAPHNIQEKISVFKTIDDYINLKKIVDKSKSIAVIGGGFLGSELACALAKYGENKNLKVHQIFHEKGNMGKVLPEFLSIWTMERVREEGINVIPNNQVQSVDLSNNQLRLKLLDGTQVLCDHAVVAVGSEPNIQLAKESGLEVDSQLGGYLVNAEMEARRHLYVAGDASCFYDVKLGRRRVEHHDHAVVSGRLAGENMVGLKKPYTHQSMFWSDLGPRVGYEAIGIIDSTLPTVSVFAKLDQKESEKVEVDGGKANGTTTTGTKLTQSVKTNAESKKGDSSKTEQDDFSKGVVFYLRDEKIVGIVLWNVFNRINTARAIITEGKKYDDLNEVAKLFDIHT